MRRRPGHARPVGTLTAPHRFSPFGERAPELGDVTFQTDGPGGDTDDLRRAFLLVGIEETASVAYPHRLIFERLDYEDAWQRVYDGWPMWAWHNAR